MKKIGFVIPWYGENIGGGAEAELKGIVHHLQDAGVELEVLTTCVKDFTSDWNVNYHSEGVTTETGIRVIRFKVRKRNTRKFDKINKKFIEGELVTPKEEKTFLTEMINSPKLYKYIRENKQEYGLFVFIPYMFGTTYFGVQECMEKAVLIPCFHDEGYAHMSAFKDIFSNVAGMIFNASPEAELAEKLFRLDKVKTIVMGIGIDTEISGMPEAFRAKFDIHDPFILYAGRKETGKNIDELVTFFAKWKAENNNSLKLVLIGGGSVSIPESVKSEVIDLGFVEEQDKYDAYSAAEFLCQPSKNESFSLVIMESWLCGRPVLVNSGCPVTKNFVDSCQGGLYYGSYDEFNDKMKKLLVDKNISKEMGEKGRKFVKSTFSWSVIVEKYLDFFESVAR